MQNKNQKPKTKTKSKQLSMNALGENNLNACRRLNGFYVDKYVIFFVNKKKKFQKCKMMMR